MKRILLSVPHMGEFEQGYVEEAFRSNWLSTVGPNLTGFEDEFERWVSLPSVALGSGTAAIHLGLRALGVGPGDEVFCQDLTFVASVNPVRYLGARPVLLDSEYQTWNLDPQVLETALRARAARGRLPRAVIVVHLFGHCADLDALLDICGRYDVPLFEDAAEALGAEYKGRPAGSFGAAAAFSFNGNKIITTTGGGMLVSPDRNLVNRARHWATQARDAGISYEHSELGYNYRLSNVLAGIGRGQLRVLAERVEQRRKVAFRYRDAFQDLEGIEFMPQAQMGLATHWLSCFLIEADLFGCTRDELIRALDAASIEARPVWKPMHLQDLYRSCECFGGSVSEDLFARGICLPSSSSMTEEEQCRVIQAVRNASRQIAAEPAERTVISLA